MGDMTATEQLRAMLDERGVEYTTVDGEHVKETCWPYMGELMAAFAEFDNGTTRFACDTWCFTPQQAIAATLGAGTCKRVMDSLDPFTQWVCNQCGHPLDASDKFCSGCGKKVVD